MFILCDREEADVGIQNIGYVICMCIGIACGGSAVRGPPDGGGAFDESDRRGTLTNGIDITEGYSEIIRARGGDRERNDEDELFLAQGNRAVFYVVVENRSDGWVPVNFEICVDHTDVLAVLAPEEHPEEAGFLGDGAPCAVRYEDGDWFRLEQGDEEDLRAGSVLALEQPGGGYVTIYLRVEFPETGVLDLWEYTFPYRVLP
jgi:hypothetical protein